MGSIRVHEFITLDGVISAPSWTMDFGFDPKMGDAIGAAMAKCDGILLGRVTYEMFAPAWSSRSASDDPGAPFMNDTTKFVVSSTLTTTSWQNSTVVGPYDPSTIATIKERCPGGIYVSGSATLVHAMLADGLVDELHLCEYPLTLGEDPRLFESSLPSTTWTLDACESYENGVVYRRFLR